MKMLKSTVFLNENNKFFELPIGGQAEIIIQKAKNKEAQIKPIGTNVSEFVLNRLTGV